MLLCGVGATALVGDPGRERRARVVHPLHGSPGATDQNGKALAAEMGGPPVTALKVNFFKCVRPSRQDREPRDDDVLALFEGLLDG